MDKNKGNFPMPVLRKIAAIYIAEYRIMNTL